MYSPKKTVWFYTLTVLFCLNSFFLTHTVAQNLLEGAKLHLGKGSISEVKYSPDGTKLGVLSAIGVWIYDAQTGEELNLLTGHIERAFSIAFSPDGRTLATGNDDGTVHLWDVKMGENIKTLTADPSWVWSVAFSPDSRTLATGGFSTLRLWDVETGENIKTLQDRGLRYSVAFSPDGRTLATESMLDPVRLWDVETGENIRTFQDPGFGRGRGSFAFSPTGSMLAIAKYDGSIVHLWYVSSPRVAVWTMRSLTGHPSKVNSIAFSPDGNTFATGNDDGTVRLWNVVIHQAVPNYATFEIIKTLTGHRSEVNSIAFSPDGRTLATGSSDGTVLLWELSLSTLTLPEDVNGDGMVNILDLTLVASNFGKRGRTDADVNDDGVVNIGDLILVAAVANIKKEED